MVAQGGSGPRVGSLANHLHQCSHSYTSIASERIGLWRTHWRMIIGLQTLFITYLLPFYLSSYCSGLGWMLHTSILQTDNLMKYHGPVQRTEGIMPAQLTRCSSMAVWHHLSKQRYGKPGLPHDACFSPSYCARTESGLRVGWCRGDGLMSIFALFATATWRQPLTWWLNVQHLVSSRTKSVHHMVYLDCGPRTGCQIEHCQTGSMNYLEHPAQPEKKGWDLWSS
jgi:hypothetical protein